MAIPLTAEDLAPLVPLAETRAALREALLPHCDNHRLAANARLEVDHSTTNVYLLTGGVRAQNSSGSQKYFAISGDTRLPLPLPSKGRGSITTESSTHIITVDRRRVNTVLAWANLYDDGDSCDCWLPPILRSELLARLPAPNVHALLLNASAQSFKPNTRIVSQGDGGEYYYLIVSGTCQVTRETDSGLELVLATLEAGESFGEEALLTGETRNAAIETGLQGATVLAIGAADFRSQIEASLVSFMDFPDLRAPGDRAVWLDVRTADEFAHDGIPGATHIPLDEIRDARDTLTRDSRYLVYCDSGRRAAAGAFLMAEAGLDVVAMTGSRQDLRAAEREDEKRLKRRLDGARERLEASLKDTAHPGADEKAVRTDPDLRAQIEMARSELQSARESNRELEQKLRDEYSEPARHEAELRVQRDALRVESEAILAVERERMQQLCQQAEAQIQQLTVSLARLHRAADVARAEQIRNAELRHEHELAEQSERAIYQERQRLEQAVADSVTQVHVAARAFAADDRDRLANKSRARQALANRRERQAAACAEPGALSGEQEALNEYAGGMGNNHPPADVARPIMAEDSLWLQMQTEVESLLRKEADDVKERAAEAASQLELAWDQRTAAMEREAREQEADQTLLADIGAQLHAEDVIRIAGEAACPRARSEHVEDTLHSRLKQSRARRESIARARAHLARLRKKNPPETRD